MPHHTSRPTTNKIPVAVEAIRGAISALCSQIALPIAATVSAKRQSTGIFFVFFFLFTRVVELAFGVLDLVHGMRPG